MRIVVGVQINQLLLLNNTLLYKEIICLNAPCMHHQIYTKMACGIYDKNDIDYNPMVI